MQVFHGRYSSVSRFVYEPSVPKEVRETISKYLAPYEWMIPRWCERVNVEWEAEDGESALSIMVSFEYRFADMTVYPAWLECDEDVRHDTCIHELIHLHVNPLFNYADRTITLLTDEDDLLRGHAHEELRRYCEGVTQDLARTIFERLHVEEEETPTA